MAFWSLRKKEDPGPPWPAASPEAVSAFEKFYNAETLLDTLAAFKQTCDLVNLPNGGRFKEFYPLLRNSLKDQLPYKYKKIWDILDKKSKNEIYQGNRVADTDRNRVLVIGAGPCGLRTAIETQLMGARTVVVEKRPNFTRNNVLKLWKWVVEDLKSIGAKKFYGSFGTGTINHINIKILQLVLTKICLMLGIHIYAPVQFNDIAEPVLAEEGGEIAGWKAQYKTEGNDADSFVFDVLVCASGANCVLDSFKRYALDAKVAIAITANFVNKRTHEELEVQEISGLSRQYDQEFFKKMNEEAGVDLENLVYYKSDTHYFVMTALKGSLLKMGVLKEDILDEEGSKRAQILAPSNVDKEKLMEYAIKAADYATEQKSVKLPHHDWALIPRGPNGSPDCCIFDFTNLYAARCAGKVLVRKGQPLLMSIVGDSQLQPFWPEGTGCAKGFLSSMDAAWMIRDWFLQKKNPLKILAEREMTRFVLPGVTSYTMKTPYSKYTMDPTTRYKVIPKKYETSTIVSFYDSDVPEEVEFLKEKFGGTHFWQKDERKSILQTFRARFKTS